MKPIWCTLKIGIISFWYAHGISTRIEIVTVSLLANASSVMNPLEALRNYGILSQYTVSFLPSMAHLIIAQYVK